MLARYGPASAEQTLGALPVAAAFCRKPDIAGIIDRAAPVRAVARASHGQVIEALIANRKWTWHPGPGRTMASLYQKIVNGPPVAGPVVTRSRPR